MRPSSLLFLLATTLLLVPGCATATPTAQAAAQLTVHGSARVSLPADQARLNLAVVTTAPTAKAALAANSRGLAAVEAALQKAGLPSSDYRTGNFEIRPDWSPRPRDAAPDWRSAIIGYTVRNSLRVTTGQLERLGTLIEAGVAAGANAVDGLVFDLADASAAKTAAIAEATADANGQAKAAAAAAGVRLGPVRAIEVAPGPEPAPVRLMRMAAEAAAPPLSPGEVQVSAQVTVVYEILE